MEMEKFFPVSALLPKRDTGIDNFLAKYPDYDGRGTKIAIFDSGVDPGAPGLQKTSDGLPKIIERHDCSGAGDVDTSTIVEKQEGGYIIGLTKRHLKIPESWQCPSGQFHIGIKNAYDLYPKSLRERIQKERKMVFWDTSYRQAQSIATQKLVYYLNENLESEMEKNYKEDYEAQLEILSSLEKKFEDAGPVYDCVVFFDGSSWKAVLDTSETGNLEECSLLRSYNENFEYAKLTKADMMNYSVNIRDNGNLLEIVGTCSPHGTHVASIAAANFPGDPIRNGIAPGAQLVSLAIGDSRIGTMETGTAVVRAIIAAIKLKVDVINMSYGEPVHWPSNGRIGELINELIHKHGILLVCSAGNRGPALSTVVAPPVLGSRSIISVGAYVSPEMTEAEYSFREKIPSTIYTWSSRGPSVDGDLGISVCAPGGAITSVPNWTLKGSQLMNGTSMSSPHCCGSIALLISGLKKLSIPYSPCSIKRSIENTALFLHHLDYFAQGHGLLQVDSAFDHLKETADCCENDIHFSINCGGTSHGIYIREVYKLVKSTEYHVTVDPIFMDDSKVDPQRKIDFGIRLVLTCDAPWVSLPTYLDLSYTSRTIVIGINPLGLPLGLHYTSIKAFDAACPKKGPLFRIPITVVKPHLLNELTNYQMEFNDVLLQPSAIIRQYFVVPYGAARCEITIRLVDPAADCKVVIHSVQLLNNTNFKRIEFYKLLNLSDQREATHSFGLNGTSILELAVAEWWAIAKNVKVSYSVSFHGLITNCRPITMYGSEGIHRINVSSHVHYEELSPVVTLKYNVQILKPSSYKIKVLGQRDLIGEGRQIYENQLTYHFAVCKATDLTPSCPILSEVLYESEFESQLWMLFNSNKRLLCCGDAYPSGYTCKIERGNYTLKLHVRHEKKELVEKMSDLVMHLSYRLTNSITLDTYATYSAAVVGGKKFGAVGVPCGSLVPLYVAPYTTEKIPKNGTAIHYFTGSISLTKDEYSKKHGHHFKYILSEPMKKATKESSKDREKVKDEDLVETMKNFKISLIQKMEIEGAGADLYNELIKDNPDDVSVIMARVNVLNTNCTDKNREKVYEEISPLLDKIISSISEESILVHLATQKNENGRNNKSKSGNSNNNNNNNNGTMEKQKNMLIDALIIKGTILGDNIEKESSEVKTDALLKDYGELIQSLNKLIEPSDPKVVYCFATYYFAMGLYGKALKLLLKQYEEKPSLDLEKKFLKVYKRLNWSFITFFLENTQFARYPPKHRLF